jgi:hypothetical protein
MESNGNKYLNEERFRAISGWLIIIGTAAFSAVFFTFIITHSWGENAWIVEIVKSHFPATIGLPLAAIASICIVFLFKYVSGQIELEGFGIKFKGAAAPVILWILCFLAISSMIKVLW